MFISLSHKDLELGGWLCPAKSLVGLTCVVQEAQHHVRVSTRAKGDGEEGGISLLRPDPEEAGSTAPHGEEFAAWPRGWSQRHGCHASS